MIAAIYLSAPRVRRRRQLRVGRRRGGDAAARDIRAALLLTLLWLGLQVLDTKKIKETKVADGVFDVANAARMGRKWSLMTPRGKTKKGLSEEARASTSTSTATKRIMALASGWFGGEFAVEWLGEGSADPRVPARV